MLFYENVKGDVEERYDKSRYDERRRKSPLPVVKHKKLIGLMKDEHISKITAMFASPRAKTYAFKVQKDDHEVKDSVLED